jgi:hypothetical protein
MRGQKISRRPPPQRRMNCAKVDFERVVSHDLAEAALSRAAKRID